MAEQTQPQPSNSDDSRRTFTIRESLRAKYGYDATAAMIRAMYDRAESKSRTRKRRKR